MKKNLLKYVLFLLGLGLAGVSFAGDVYVISNSALKLTVADARDIFLGEKQFAGGMALAVVDNREVQADFVNKVLKMDGKKYKIYWAQLSFRDGVPPPHLKANDAEVLAYVKATPGAVGYVSTPPSGVNVIQKY